MPLSSIMSAGGGVSSVTDVHYGVGSLDSGSERRHGERTGPWVIPHGYAYVAVHDFLHGMHD